MPIVLLAVAAHPDGVVADDMYAQLAEASDRLDREQFLEWLALLEMSGLIVIDHGPPLRIVATDRAVSDSRRIEEEQG